VEEPVRASEGANTGYNKPTETGKSQKGPTEGVAGKATD